MVGGKSKVWNSLYGESALELCCDDRSACVNLERAWHVVVNSFQRALKFYDGMCQQFFGSGGSEDGARQTAPSRWEIIFPSSGAFTANQVR